MSSNSKNIAELFDSSGLITKEKLAPGAGGTNWSVPAVQTSDFTAISSNGYFVDTSSGTITVTLPASPAKGDYIALVDYAGTNSDAVENGSYTNRIQIDPNGSKINGSTGNKDIGATRGGVQLVYVDSTQGWIVTDAANEGDTKALVVSSPAIDSVLNSVDAAWFQTAGDTITVNGTGFASGLSVILIDTIGSTEYTASNVVLVNENQVTFDIPAGAVSSGQVAGEDPFDVKVLNSNGSYAISSDALEYAPTPTFQTSNASPLGIVTATTNDPSADAFADLGVTISAVSLDPDDTVTYAITTLPTELTGLTINSSTGALVGDVPTNGFPANDTSTNYTFTVTATATSAETSDTKTDTRNFVITLEGNVSAPTVTSVDQNYISQSGTEITVTGTGFKDVPAVTLLAPDSTPYIASSVTFDSATQIRFQTTSAMATAIETVGQVSGDERFDLKVTNPASGYSKSGTLANAFEYIAAPTFNVDAGTVGALFPEAGQDYSTLTTATLDADPVDPDDTITYSLTNVAAELANLTINSSTGALSGTADLSAANLGTYNFTVLATSTSAETGNTQTDNRTYSIKLLYTVDGHSTSASHLMIAGGQTVEYYSILDNVELKQFSSSADGVDHGDLASSTYAASGASDGTQLLVAGGGGSSALIQLKQFSSSAAGIVYGALTVGRIYSAGASDGSQAMIAGGGSSNPTNIIDMKQFSSSANAVDHGDLSEARYSLASASDGSQAMFGGGDAVGSTAIDMKQFSSTAIAIDHGDFFRSRSGCSGASDGTQAMFGGGEQIIELKQFSSTAIAIYYGQHYNSIYRTYIGTGSDGALAMFAGGGTGGSDNIVDLKQFSSAANAVYHGVLTPNKYATSAGSGNA
jgi:hypothetical protein